MNPLLLVFKQKLLVYSLIVLTLVNITHKNSSKHCKSVHSHTLYNILLHYLSILLGNNYISINFNNFCSHSHKFNNFRNFYHKNRILDNFQYLVKLKHIFILQIKILLIQHKHHKYLITSGKKCINHHTFHKYQVDFKNVLVYIVIRNLHLIR